MTTYEMSEYKVDIVDLRKYLNCEVAGNTKETVSLTNDDVKHIIKILSECLEILDNTLKLR